MSSDLSSTLDLMALALASDLMSLALASKLLALTPSLLPITSLGSGGSRKLLSIAAIHNAHNFHDQQLQWTVFYAFELVDKTVSFSQI